jgi:hypothetical protein
MTTYNRRQMLNLSAAAVLGAAGPLRSVISKDTHMLPAPAANSKAAIKTRMFWTWDHTTEWALNLPGAHTMGAANAYSRTTEAFVEDYTKMFRWCGRQGVDAVVLWGLLRDSHGGLETAKRLCDIASKHGVRLLCGVGLNAYGGVYYEGNSPYSLEQHLKSRPELVALDQFGHPMCKPFLYVACPSRRENQEFAAESLQWLFKNLPLGGVQMETGDYAVCHCSLCWERRKYPVSRFSWEDMALMYPIAAEAIRSVYQEAWIVCETYSHPEPYSGKKDAPSFGDGKPTWADECLARFPKGDGIFVQWVCDKYIQPKSLRSWTKAGTVSNTHHRNIMRSHLSTYWFNNLRGELAIDWLADMVQKSMNHDFDAISIFGEVSPFDTGAELNYLALENYGSAKNLHADLEAFLKEVAAPLLGGDQYAHDYLHYARMLEGGRREIPGAVKDIYAHLGSLPPAAARRWVWLANYLGSFVYSSSALKV